MVVLVSHVPVVWLLPPTRSPRAHHQLPKFYHFSEPRYQAGVPESHLLGVLEQLDYVDGILVPVLVNEVARAAVG